MHHTETTHQVDPEFDAMWDAQLLSFPTITRKADGSFNYFDVTPTGDFNTDWARGEALARESLRLARQYREADSCAMLFILSAAHDACTLGSVDLQTVAGNFVDTVISEAVRAMRHH